jgi:phospholipid transport system substrate-binding protein
MNMHRHLDRVSISVLMALLLSAGNFNINAAEINYQAEPFELVRQVTEELFERINNNRQLYQNDQQQLEQMIRNVFLPLLNERFSARLILGKHSRGLSEAQINDFADALMNQLLGSYADGLLEFESRDQIQVLPLRGDNN